MVEAIRAAAGARRGPAVFGALELAVPFMLAAAALAAFAFAGLRTRPARENHDIFDHGGSRLRWYVLAG